MTKTHICDPHFTRKVFENRLDDIRYCTRCLQVCHGKMDVMSCVYNPFTRRELEWGDLKPAEPKRRIVRWIDRGRTLDDRYPRQRLKARVAELGEELRSVPVRGIRQELITGNYRIVQVLHPARPGLRGGRPNGE